MKDAANVWCICKGLGAFSLGAFSLPGFLERAQVAEKLACSLVITNNLLKWLHTTVSQVDPFSGTPQAHGTLVVPSSNA